MGLWGRGRDNGLICSLSRCAPSSDSLSAGVIEWWLFWARKFISQYWISGTKASRLWILSTARSPLQHLWALVFVCFSLEPFWFQRCEDDAETWAPVFDSPRHFSLCRITSPFTCYLLRGWLQGLGRCLPLSVTQYSGLKCWSYYYLLLKMSLLAEIMHWPHWFF